MKVRLFKPSLFFVLLALSAFWACKPDPVLDDCGNRNGNYDKGIFVVNEGSFNGTGSITWHDASRNLTVEDVYASENCGAVLGQFVQSLTFHNGKGYIVVNGANKIVVVDASTFEYLDTIGGLGFPRYFYAIDNNTAYVTQWGADGFSGSLAKVDLNTNKVLSTIALPQPEKMFKSGANTLLVANVGGYGLDSTVSWIDLNLGQEVDRRKFRGAPSGFAALNGTPYVICKGGYGPAPNYDAYPGWLANTTNGNGFELLPGADDLCANPAGNTLYYVAGGIWSFNGTGAPVKIVDQPSYGLACDPVNGNLYCSNPKDFSSPGSVSIYKPDGTKVSTFAVGIAPGEIVIRN
jgi:DNA-binding beta-propeller fold protein YncE